MIPRFFIDRPIFAAVLSIVITLTGAIALWSLPLAQYPEVTPPSVQVSISYPGASAQVVADTVAAPIEQQVNGVENMLYMTSQSGNDGSYSLTVTFDVGTNLNTALVMVQNRVTLAIPQLPNAVQMQGITIRKKTPDILMVVAFFSPDRRYDDIYLSNYTTIHINDEILRVDGVSDIHTLGERDYSIRVWLDPQELAARNMAPGDVALAIRSQNVEAVLGQLGQPPVSSSVAFQMPMDTLGRLRDPEQFGNILVKVGPGKNVFSNPQATPAPSNANRRTATNQMLQGGSLIGSNLLATGPATAPGSSSSSTLTQTNSTGSSGASSGSNPNSAAISSNISSSSPSSSSTNSSNSSPGAPAMTGLLIGSPNAVSGGLSGSNASISGGLLGSSLNTSVTGSPSRNAPGVATGLVRLRDVARVELAAQNYNQSCSFNGQPAVGLAIWQLPGTNALDVADRVLHKLEELKTRFPEGVDYRIAYDTTPFIRDSISDVEQTLFEAIAIVAVVVLVFLQSWRAALIPLIAVPVAIVGTFGPMAVLGFSLNNISLFGLVLAIGIVVDDAIVVVENVERWLEQGTEAHEAARKAMDEVTGPVIAVALVLCAVFVPCAFISGITGRFFRQFAVTIAVSTTFSAINSLTLSPALAAILLKPRNQGQAMTLPRPVFAVLGGWLAWRFAPGSQTISIAAALGGALVGWLLGPWLDRLLAWLFGWFNRAFAAGTSGYTWAVARLLRLSAIVLVAYAGLVGLTWWLFERTPTGFVPEQDQGRLIVNIQTPDSASLERTQDAVARVVKVLHETPGVMDSTSISGLSFLQNATSPNFASLFVTLEPFEKRRDPSMRDTAIMARLRRAWAEEVKDAEVTVFGAPPIPGLSVAGGFKLMVEDRTGLGPEFLQQETDALVGKMRQEPGLVGVFTQFRSNTPQLYMDIDRAKAEALGISFGDVDQALELYLGSLYVNSFNDFGRHWQVTMQAAGDFRDQVKKINLIQVRNRQGQMVPLGALADIHEISGPVMVTRYNLYPAAPILGNLRTNVSSGPVIADVDAVASQSLPRSMSTEWTELMFMQIRAGNTALAVFGLSVVFVFLALAALYESWSLPLAVILVVPLCLLCSIAGVQYTHNAVNIFVQIGLVVLVGLACKNAILIVEFAQATRREGRPTTEATLEACRLRLRPILMTSFAFILGVLPLVLASGAGAEMRRSLGTAVFTGMLGVTLFGIFLTPVFFYVIEQVGETRMIQAAVTLWGGSALLGALLGAALGYLLSLVGVGRLPWGPVIGAGTCALLALLLPAFRRRIGGQRP